MSRPAKPEVEYCALAEAEPASEALDHGAPRRRSVAPEYEARRSGSSTAIHAGIVFLELVACAVLIAGFVVLDEARPLQGTGRGLLDGLARLASYNSSMRFDNGSSLLADSRQADDYWRRLLESGGVVSLDTDWALRQGLRPSAQSPTDASRSIYQVDVFHALHCLNSIRQNLVSKTPPAWDETHVLHCLDYLRHQLLCHPDLTLTHTDDLQDFVLDESHSCRDYGAVVDWVHGHRWVEFPEWLRAKENKEMHDGRR